MASFELIPGNSQILAIHAALLPVGTKGKIILFGGDEHNAAQAGRDGSPADPAQVDNTRIYDVATKTISMSTSPTTDVFCSGHAFLGDGRLIIGGGTESWEGGGGPGGGHVHGLGNFGGHPACWAFNYLRNSWERIADFNFDASHNKTGGGRWYPTLVTLANGDLIAISGHPSRRSIQWHNNNIPEIYSQATGQWRWIKPTSEEITFYPRVHLIKGGLLFICAVEDGTSRFYNPLTGDFQGPSIASPGGLYDGWDNTSVLLPLLPNENYRARVLMCDDIIPKKIDLEAATPAWQNAGSRTGAALNRVRKWGISTILPDGKILVFGGVSSNTDASAVLEPEIYEPGINWTSGHYSNPESWQSLPADPNNVARNYHSTNLLLPDGSVFTAGSSHDANSGDPASVGEMRMVIFKPDYFDDAARPDLISSALSSSYGKQIKIETPQASSIQRVALIRNGSSTHAFNADQRYVGLNFSVDNANSLSATIPSDSSVLPPGYYMLWIIDNAGRPCKQASFIRIAFQHNEIITDHSTYSVKEVDAGLTGGDAMFQRAFYVVYDGYIPSELRNFTTPPAINFTFDSVGGAGVPDMVAVLADIEYEDTAKPVEIPQKVKFVFDVKFTGNNAFSFPANTRNVWITATLGQNISAAVINFTKAANPYMVDGTTSWLSVDLRVFQLKQGQVKASIPQGGSGNDFINLLLTRFNSLPDNDYHPFKSITIDQEDSKLELSETVGGVTVFNYAIAKVRYKAPILNPPSNLNDAENVKVFFRMFNTAGTAMNYNTATTYKRAGTGATAISLIGLEGGAISSIPFFAAPRVNTSSVSMATQTDDKNKITLLPNNNTEVVAYFGCWLDINRDGTKLFPLNPVNDGPFPSSGKKSILELIRGVHQCLVAEVYFDADPTPANATPGSSDNLSQRNLAIVPSDNPGNQATHTVQHTFEIKPSPYKVLPTPNNLITPPNEFTGHALTHVNRYEKEITGPDLLLIHWNNLPRESKILLYTPDVKVDDILALEPYTRLSSTKIKKEDEYTFSFLAGDVNYIPLPGGIEKNIPGLITIELPPTVVKGQLFNILVQQARYIRNSRRIIGSFQINIPVTTAALMLPAEMRNLAVLKHIHNAIPVTDSWYKIFNKYIKGLSDKVDGLGGDATNVPASPNDKWMDDGALQPPTTSLLPNNLDEVSGDIKDAIRCISKHAENIGCIKVKKITLDIHFKDKDC